MYFLKPKWADAWWDLIKKEGVKAFIKKKGWTLFAVFFLFYLIRDVTLYILIPYFLIDNITGC
jgi:hypothetical protein